MYILVCKVGNTQNRFLLDGILLLHVIYLYHSYMTSTVFIFLYHLRSVHQHFLNTKRTTNYVHVMTHIVINIGIFLCAFPQSEDVVFLYVPHIAFRQCLQS